MAINTTPKEMPTRDGNPTAGGTINKLNFFTAKHHSKASGTLRFMFSALSACDGVEYQSIRETSAHRSGTLAKARDHRVTLLWEVVAC